MSQIRTDHVIDEGLQAEIRAAYQELADSLNLLSVVEVRGVMVEK